MGASSSSNGERRSKRSWTWKNGDEAIVKLMLPVYYTPQGMTAAEVKLAKSSWDLIADDLSPVYLEKLCSTTFSKSYSSCKDWFLEKFYDRVFDVHPLCKPMFKSAMSKGSFIHGLLSFLFTVLSNKKEFHAKLLQIADSHCRKGVKAIEYGIIGEHCLGKTTYTDAVHQAWVKIFSAMLRVIVPVAVAHELASNEAQKNRRLDHNAAFGYQMSDDSRKEYNEKLAAANVCPVIANDAKDEKRSPEGTDDNTPIASSEPPTPAELGKMVKKDSIQSFTKMYNSRKIEMQTVHPYNTDVS